MTFRQPANTQFTMVVSDLDGTLLNDRSQISERNKRAVLQCLEKGILMILASGKYYTGITPYARQLNLQETHHVADNGATIFSPLGGGEKTLTVMPAHDYTRLIHRLQETEQLFAVVNAEGIFYRRESICTELMRPLNGNAPFYQTDDLLSLKEPFRLTVFYDREEDAGEILAEEYEDIHGFISGPTLIDFANKATNKYRGVEEIARMYDIPTDRILTIGDANNDLEMMQRGAVGVCVSNATAEIKDIANVVLDETNNEDAVAVALHRFILD